MFSDGKRKLQVAQFLRHLAVVLIRRFPDEFRNDGALNIHALVQQIAAKKTATLGSWSETQQELARDFDALPHDRKRYLAAEALADLQGPEGSVSVNGI